MYTYILYVLTGSIFITYVNIAHKALLQILKTNMEFPLTEAVLSDGGRKMSHVPAQWITWHQTDST